MCTTPIFRRNSSKMKVLLLAGKAAPKVIREDTLCGMLPKKIKE